MPECKACEIPRNEAYSPVRRSDEGWAKRSRWAFFNGLLQESLRRGRTQQGADRPELALYLLFHERGG